MAKNGLCKASARENGDPWEGQQPFRLNPNGVGNCTTTLRRLLIGAVFPSLCAMVVVEVWRDIAKPNNYRNHVLEHIDFAVVY